MKGVRKALGWRKGSQSRNQKIGSQIVIPFLACCRIVGGSFNLCNIRMKIPILYAF